MRLSKLISIVLHPIFIPVITLYLSISLIPSLIFSISNYLSFIYLVLIFSTIFIPLILILFLIKIKLVSSLEMSNCKERTLPLFITAISMIIGYYILSSILVFSPFIKAEIIGAIIIVIIASGVSIYWKISLHMLAIGGCVGALCGLNFLFGNIIHMIITCILLSGILGFSRLKEKAHNHLQIYVGFLVGFFIEVFSIMLI